MATGLEQVKPNAILCGPLFPEPVLVLSVTPVGNALDVRFIEVKSRANTGEIALTANEYRAAQRLKQKYWLHAVTHGATTSTLTVLRGSAQVDGQPVAKIEQYRLVQKGKGMS